MWEIIRDILGILKWLNIYVTEILEKKEKEVKAICEEVIVEEFVQK